MSTQTNELTHQTRLTRRFQVADRTMAFQFEKPSGFTFRPGQWIDITLLNPGETDAKGNTRGFSIASAPHEDFLLVATRLRDSAFKRELSRLPLTTEVQLQGPGGSLALHHNVARTAVFLAGGIGITPVRSILLRAAHDRLPHQIVVIYSNHRPEDAPFLDELTTLQKENPNYRLIATMTDVARSARAWNGETGRITAALLKKHLTDASSPIYYVIGPPGMVNGTHEMLTQSGVDEDDIRSEDFGGY